jgi:hypothetical protein
MSETFPEGWTKTVQDLVAERARTISAEEWEWARAYERSRLRPWARFPRNGDIYEALEDMPIRYLTHWRAPFTGGGTGALRKGTRVRVEVPDGDIEPIGVYADPLERDAIERELIPASDRAHEKYSGYSLSIGTKSLNRQFRLVSDVKGPQYSVAQGNDDA